MSFILLGILNSQAAGAGGAGAYELLETTVLTSSASSVSFTGLGSYTDYKHLQIRMLTRGTFSDNGNAPARMRFNSDTSVSYATHRLFGNGSSVFSSNFVNRDRIQFNDSTPNATAGADAFGAMVIDILDFSNTNKNTTVRALHGAVASLNHIHLDSGAYFKTDAITSTELINADQNFATGSRFSLYGIR